MFRAREHDGHGLAMREVDEPERTVEAHAAAVDRLDEPGQAVEPLILASHPDAVVDRISGQLQQTVERVPDRRQHAFDRLERNLGGPGTGKREGEPVLVSVGDHPRESCARQPRGARRREHQDVDLAEQRPPHPTGAT